MRSALSLWSLGEPFGTPLIDSNGASKWPAGRKRNQVRFKADESFEIVLNETPPREMLDNLFWREKTTANECTGGLFATAQKME
jgi:hypothetical protein